MLRPAPDQLPENYWLSAQNQCTPKGQEQKDKQGYLANNNKTEYYFLKMKQIRDD